MNNKLKMKTASATAASKPVSKKAKMPASSKVATPAVIKKRAALRSATKAVKPKKNSEPVISHETIALRAYFISQQCHQQAVHGDSTQHWLEAERQLIAELS